MIINISSLSDGDILELHHEYDAEKENLNFRDETFSGSLRLDGEAIVELLALHVKGILSGKCVCTCSRCLNDFEKEIDLSIELFFEIRNRTKIDITDDIREAVIFDHPEKLLCSEECKGICQRCGQDLNIDQCTCDNESADEVEPEGDNNFADLKKILKQKKEN